MSANSDLSIEFFNILEWYTTKHVNNVGASNKKPSKISYETNERFINVRLVRAISTQDIM